MPNIKIITFLSAVIAQEIMFNDDSDDEVEITVLEKVDLFSEEVIPRIENHQFQLHFRIDPDTFEDLLRKLSITFTRNIKVGNPELNFEKQVLLTVWYLANLESFRSVADRFGISKSTAWSVFYKTCLKLIRINEIYLIITWPSERQAINNINAFRRKANFPGIVGAIDGSHIPIKAPINAQNSYINRKGFHSVLLQGVCDHNLKFIDCYTGEAGSIHDSMLFRRSDLSTRLPNLNFPQNGHLVGDAAYKLTTTLMVPYKNYGHLTRQQIIYNKAHSASRVLIEYCFAYLKGRFRRLKLLETTIVEFGMVKSVNTFDTFDTATFGK
ncbi:hypothetical protein NQ314_016564 [Rhamnusium bicolor]|uniref:DDE Tnp4 domain-containing protein n=1 Tax=Rhamnusium bicolor TaxID=1586634 RepID=A0AAV8WW29_9CUCU|nr:hypothetical protein NQ314_016564 [Rhamnusium bicolor]